jgi:hypothetical protein
MNLTPAQKRQRIRTYAQQQAREVQNGTKCSFTP